ncbi:MAG TPA: hypothetical protein VFV50_07960 [Bdellovibrionales bacterium]|nr:hypothetical protein [Bdellovibrionales bacterium]
MRLARIAALIAGFLLPLSSFALTSKEAITQLKAIQTNNRAVLQKTDRAIQDTLKRSRDIKAQHLVKGDVEAIFRSIEDAINEQQFRKREYLLRDMFLNELINKFASAFSGGDARDFMEKQLLEMAATELGVGSFEQPPSDEYWRFLTYLSVAIREMPEQIEDPFKFAEAYMNFSTISNPKQPGEFRAQRNYFNSLKAEAGKPVTPDRVDDKDDAPKKQ